MKYILNSNQIPALDNKNLKERQALINQAEKKLTVPEKLILNLLKLLMLIPPFLFLARQEWLALLGTITCSLLVYVLIYRNRFLTFISKKL